VLGFTAPGVYHPIVTISPRTLPRSTISHRQVEPARAGAPWVEPEHAIALVAGGTVRVSRDHHAETARCRIEVQLGNIMDYVDEKAAPAVDDLGHRVLEVPWHNACTRGGQVGQRGHADLRRDAVLSWTM
jgi:hypothetical protein